MRIFDAYFPINNLTKLIESFLEKLILCGLFTFWSDQKLLVRHAVLNSKINQQPYTYI